MAALTRKEETRLHLEAQLGQILADSANVVLYRTIWSKHHPDLPALDVHEAWNRAQTAKQLIGKLSAGEEIDVDDVLLVQSILVQIGRENRPDGDVVE